MIASTQRWLVVQNQEGQQFPIATDRIRQFLVRWPASVNDLSPSSMVEATGFYSDGALMVDHIDVYEADAQNLVTPTMQTLSGSGSAPMTFDSFTQGNFGIINYVEVGGAAMNPGVLHVVGRSAGINPLLLTAGATPNTLGVVPGPGGMSVTQVTLGTYSYPPPEPRRQPVDPLQEDPAPAVPTVTRSRAHCLPLVGWAPPTIPQHREF